jgi:ionotropic glutamate receptor NMDA 3A
MWGLLFSHLVAFKAPKSWPNKFLINVWGGFSVIFLASYTANIAALFAGVFSETTVTNFHDPRVSTDTNFFLLLLFLFFFFFLAVPIYY